jgi:hypothetical protein
MFLALLAHPSALPYGLTSPLFVPANPPIARLQLGGILPPVNGGAFPLLSSFLHDVQLLPLGIKPTLQPDLLQLAVITWGARAFSHVLFPVDDAGIGHHAPDSLPGYIAPFSDYCFPPEDGSDIL